jgi:hypothetical protein
MPAIGALATQAVVNLLNANTGLSFTMSSLTAQESVELPAINAGQVLAQNIAADVAERTTGVAYPAMYVYCEGLSNQLTEKFRTFSGKAKMAMEVRATHDAPDRLGSDLQLYASAAAGVLDSNRGDWGNGMFYAGGYDVEFGPVKRGGKNFLQSAKVSFEVDVSY